MMVRSAVKFVSKTASNFILLKAACSFPETMVPGAMPNSSPSCALMAGASCTTTCFVRIVECLPDFFSLALLVEGAHGQKTVHWPQFTHALFPSPG